MLKKSNFFSTLPLIALAMAGVAATADAKVADRYPVPAPNAGGYRGATVPYTRYDCNAAGDATLGGGATLKTSPDWHHANKASQASNQAYVDMPVGSSVAWTMRTHGNGVTVRYTIADKNLGSMGYVDGWKSKEGQLDIYVNGVYDVSVPLTSYHMYQYFKFGGGTPSRGQSSGDAPAFAFDEKHILLNKALKPGDTIEVKCASGDEVGVDFLEIEVVPEPIDPSEIANGRQVFNVTDFGASLTSKDNRDAFTKAVNAANKVGGVVFIPEGTWLMGYSAPGDTENQQGLWSINPKDIMITGAGMWYTNIQFTGWGRFGGGISGGNPANTDGNSTCDNVEFCNLYLNSNLCDRYGENAVYKGVMDIWTDGSVFHDVWVEHFECGFWLGDYNNAQARYSDYLRITDCRIRNNFADGVNFCLGTSNAAVFNCSVRNNGDDGLANWNDSKYGAKDETDNVFAYNTIDLIWRAGAIALYGGINQSAYNNYICDSFMSSGIHLNTTFDGHKFNGTTPDKPILFENNYLVRTGTLKECWGRNYAAIDIEGQCKNVVFRNNHIYDSPAEAIRIMTGVKGLVVDGLYVNGSGLCKRNVDYSGWTYNPGVGCFPHGGNSGSWSNFQIVEGSVAAADMNTGWETQQNWPFWDAQPANWEWVSEDAIDWAEVPPYPDSEGIVPEPDPWETLTGYDVVLTGIDWLTDQGKHSMYGDNKVTLRARIDNKGMTSIPENAKFAVRFTIDGENTFSYTVKDGLAAGASKIIEFPAAWTATLGKHVFTAEVDPAGKMLHESDRSNNSKVKNVNVNAVAEGEEPEIVIDTHSGYDMGVVKVYFENLSGDQDEFEVGDRLMPHAIVANYGSQTITLGSGQGVLWGFDGVAEYQSGMLWDDSEHVIAPGQWIDVTPNGGGSPSGLSATGWNDDYTYTVKKGDVSLYCRMDNPTKYNDNNADNNNNYADYRFPTEKPEFNENPDKADNLENGGYHDYEDGEGGGETEVTGFDLEASQVMWTPGHKEINAGEEISGFQVKVANRSDVAFPAGKSVRVTFYVDGTNRGSTVYTGGIAPNGEVILDIAGSLEMTAGGHTVKATVSNVKGELGYDNNTRERTFNAKGASSFVEPATEYVTNVSEEPVEGVHFVIRKISWKKVSGSQGARAASDDAIRPGDRIRFYATVVNNGTQPSSDIKHGIQWQLPAGNTSNIVWNDERRTGSQPGEVFELESEEGNVNTDGTWEVPEGVTHVTAWFNDTHDLGSWDHKFDFPVEVASAPKEVEMIDNPTGADNVPTAIEDVATEPEQNVEDVWYTLQGLRVSKPTTPGLYIHNGKKVIVK